MNIFLLKYTSKDAKTEGGVYAFPAEPSVFTFLLHMVFGTGIISMLKSLNSKNNAEKFHSLHLIKSCSVLRLTTGNWKFDVGVRQFDRCMPQQEALGLGEIMCGLSDFMTTSLDCIRVLLNRK